MGSLMVGETDVLEAAERIAPYVERTRLRRAGALWVKPECLQPTGSFKVRGAVNAVARLAARGDVTQVVAQSSGNHGQALAYAASLFGLQATVVVPDTAPALKMDAMRGRGASLVVVPPARREAVAVELSEAPGAALVRSDDLDVIAGHATAGLEIADDFPSFDVVLAPVCNGGLLAGVAVAVKAWNPGAVVIGVEPELAADALESFRLGRRVRWSTDLTYRTVADGLRAPVVGEHAWEHIREHVDGIVTVTEDSIAEAMWLLHEETGLMPEPSGAVATAAFLSRREALPRGRTVAVLSGGNVEAGAFHALTAVERMAA
ncbi:threonine ammonia-lyase [Solirubrobacter soli]|uniref:threonine ammonia-lyase n=1 Tax=Solirubrobacter soli TaxID=363832 RepID=UPI00040B3872|nr:threonine/serine dehydratase [Solirubrobacter soli]